jgi:hypothetical protein
MIKLAVQREDQRGIVRNAQALAVDRDALRPQFRRLLDEMPGVDDNAVADHRQLAAPHDSGRQQAQLVDHAVDDERMPGVVAALKAHHDIGLLRQPIDDLALAFVAPLGADNHHAGHGRPASALMCHKEKPGCAGNAPGPGCSHGALRDQGGEVKPLSALCRLM